MKSEVSFSDYIKASKKRILSLQGKYFESDRIKGDIKYWTDATVNEKLDKSLHGQYLNEIEGNVNSNKTWQWFQTGSVKKERDVLIFVSNKPHKRKKIEKVETITN